MGDKIEAKKTARGKLGNSRGAGPPTGAVSADDERDGGDRKRRSVFPVLVKACRPVAAAAA